MRALGEPIIPLGDLGLLALWRWRRPRELEQRAEALAPWRVTQRCTLWRGAGKACRRKENRRFSGKRQEETVASAVFAPKRLLAVDRLSRPQSVSTKNQEIAMV